MKKNKCYILLALLCIATNIAMAQNRSYEDIALGYLKERLNKKSNGLNSSETKYYELPNKNMIVMMHVKWSDGYVEDVYDLPPGAHGNYLTQQGWVHSDKVVKRTELTGDNRYAVFVSRTGSPLTYFVLPEEYDIVPIKQGYVCFLFDKSHQNVGGKSTPFYNNVICRDYDGNRLWGFPDDLIAFDIDTTENNLYIAGEIIKDDGAYSLVRTVDIKSGKTKDHIGKKGSIALSVTHIDQGIEVNEYGENNVSHSYILPYEENDKDFQFKLIMKVYNQSKASDQVSIGERYLTGRGFDKDEKKAFEWFQKAANQNSSEGQLKLGYCYQNGRGVNQDKEKAVSFYEKAAAQGNKYAIYSVAEMYANGDGIPKNMSRAVYWQEVLAFKGDKDAQKFVLANQHVEHENVKVSSDAVFEMGSSSYKDKNYEWAKYCFEKAINLGNEKAMLFYGEWLYRGDGISKDYNKAIEYLSKFGEANNLRAQKILINIYTDNTGGVPDAKQELYWRMKAADNGDTESIMKLATAYQDGIGVKKNKKLAFQMLERAASNGNKDAIKQTVLSYALGNGVKKDIYSAAEWAEDLSNEDQLAIARMFYYGDGVKKNKKLSTLIWEQLSEKHVFEAISNLALINIWSRNYSEAERLIGSIDNIPNMGYVTSHSESQYLMGILREAQGRYQQALDCYRNSSKQEAKQCYDKLNEQWRRNNYR